MAVRMEKNWALQRTHISVGAPGARRMVYGSDTEVLQATLYLFTLLFLSVGIGAIVWWNYAQDRHEQRTSNP